jgi:PDZ domain
MHRAVTALLVVLATAGSPGYAEESSPRDCPAVQLPDRCSEAEWRLWASPGGPEVKVAAPAPKNVPEVRSTSGAPESSNRNLPPVGNTPTPTEAQVAVGMAAYESALAAGRAGLGSAQAMAPSEGGRSEAQVAAICGLGVYFGNGSAQVTSVIKGSAADSAGIVAGDIIGAVNGLFTTSVSQIDQALKAYTCGDKLTLSVLNISKSRDLRNVSVTLGNVLFDKPSERSNASESSNDDLPLFEFKGVTAGDIIDLATVGKCEPIRGNDRLMRCIPSDRSVAGPSEAIESLVLIFQDNKLATMGYVFFRSRFATVFDAFSQKYGTPCRVEQRMWQNIAGAVFPNNVFFWCFSTGELELVERSADDSDDVFSTAHYSDTVNLMPPPERAPVDF